MLKERIQEDMKNAMRARDAASLGAIRLLQAAIKQKEVDERVVADDAAVLAIVEKLIKQRRESITQFEKGGRQDLVQNEKFELEMLQAYMPQAMPDAEIEAAVAEAVAAAGATGPSDMGKVMSALKGKLAGRADMGKVSTLVKEKLKG